MTASALVMQQRSPYTNSTPHCWNSSAARGTRRLQAYEVYPDPAKSRCSAELRDLQDSIEWISCFLRLDGTNFPVRWQLSQLT